jgi:hypothetical protein
VNFLSKVDALPLLVLSLADQRPTAANRKSANQCGRQSTVAIGQIQNLYLPFLRAVVPFTWG